MSSTKIIRSATRIQAFYRRIPRPEHRLLKKMIRSINRFKNRSPAATHDCQRLATMLIGVVATVDRRAVIGLLNKRFNYGWATTRGMREIQSRWARQPNFY